MKGTVIQYGRKRHSAPFSLNYGVWFETRLKVMYDTGAVKGVVGKLILKGVCKTTLLIVGNTSFYQGDDYSSKNGETLTKLQEIPFQELLNRHLRDYRAFYHRVDFSLDQKCIER